MSSSTCHNRAKAQFRDFFLKNSVVCIELSFKVHLVYFKISSLALEKNAKLTTHRVIRDGKCLP